MTEAALQSLCEDIEGADGDAVRRARERQEALVKPPGSLGELEEISVKLAGITGRSINRIEKTCVVIASADNGVTAQGVASAPTSVTLRQTLNFLRRKSGVGALAKGFGTDLLVLDVGIAGEVPEKLRTADMEDFPTRVIDRKTAYGTRDLSREPAMTKAQALAALSAGLEAASFAAGKGYDAVGAGEMGIGNTTTSSAVLSALTGLPAKETVGRGGGLTDECFQRKTAIVRRAAARCAGKDVLDVLAEVGGFDMLCMAGVYLGCAKERMPAVVDGYISMVAALAACRLSPHVRDFLFPSHRSFEKGYLRAAEELGLSPMLTLSMRLGEGSGAVLAFQILKGACYVMEHMATFAESEIDDCYLEEIRKGGCF